MTKSSRRTLSRSIEDRLDHLDTGISANRRLLGEIHAMLHHLTEKVHSMSDQVHNDVVDLQADLSRLVTLISRIHQQQGVAINTGDLEALPKLHTAFGNALDQMEAALQDAGAAGGTSGSDMGSGVDTGTGVDTSNPVQTGG